MRVTGRQLMERINDLKKQVERRRANFSSSFEFFPSAIEEGAEKPDPDSIMVAVDALEDKLVSVQHALQVFNLNCVVEFEGQRRTLLWMFKRLGSLVREYDMWIMARRFGKVPHRASRKVRDDDHEEMEYVFTAEEINERIEHAEARISAAKKAISDGNSFPMEVGDVEELFN